MLKQGFYQGNIRHHRYRPKEHSFDYSMYWTMLDLDKLEETFSKKKSWSLEKLNLISYKRKDFHHQANLTNKESIVHTIKKKTGNKFTGKVFLLSHLRYFGFNFNSVCFYFCVNENNDLKYIVSEITNTPWGERHPYVLTCKGNENSFFKFDFVKEFHISPFIKMEMDYRWSFKIEDDSMRIHMVVSEQQGGKIFDATFTANFIPLTLENMSIIPRKYPFQPLKMVWGIYWQALKLYIKRVPFISHPKYDNKNKSTKESSSG